MFWIDKALCINTKSIHIYLYILDARHNSDRGKCETKTSKKNNETTKDFWSAINSFTIFALVRVIFFLHGVEWFFFFSLYLNVCFWWYGCSRFISRWKCTEWNGLCLDRFEQRNYSCYEKLFKLLCSNFRSSFPIKFDRIFAFIWHYCVCKHGYCAKSKNRRRIDRMFMNLLDSSEFDDKSVCQIINPIGLW